MVNRNYIPEKGDLVWVNFNPTRGHEQSGVRPALVISSKLYNSKSGFLIACPITSKSKNYPFEVSTSSERVEGVILVDQVKSMDWKARKVRFISKLDPAFLSEAYEKFFVLFN